MSCYFLIPFCFILYGGINISIAVWNKLIRDNRIRSGNPKQIEHPLWALGYALIIAPMWFAFHSVCFLFSLVLLHLSVFPVAYNLLTGVPAFHLSTTSKALTDRLMVKAGLKNTAIVNVGAFILSVGFLIIQYLI